MARVFNGNMWAGIGNNVTAQRAYRDQINNDKINMLMDTAKNIEKWNSNSKLKDAIAAFYKGKEDARAAADIAEAEMVDDTLSNEESLAELYNGEDQDLLAGSIFEDDGNTIGMGKMFKRFQNKGIPFSGR